MVLVVKYLVTSYVSCNETLCVDVTKKGKNDIKPSLDLI